MLSRLLALPVLSADERQRGPMLRASLWGLLLWAVGTGATAMLTAAGDPVASTGSALLFGSLAMGALGGQWLARSGRIQIIGQLLVGFLYVGFTIVGAARELSLFLLYALLVLISGLVLGGGAAFVTGILSVLSALSITLLPIAPARPSTSASLSWAGDALALAWAVWLVYLAASCRREQGPSASPQERAAEVQGAEDDASGRLAELSKRSQRMRALIKIIQDTAGLVDEDELLRHWALSIRRELAFDQVRIYLVEPTGEQLGLRAHAIAKAGDLAQSDSLLRLGHDTFVSRAFRTGRPAASSVPDQAAGDEGSAPEGVSRQIAFPLRVDGEPIGVLSLHSGCAQVFGPEDDAMLQLLADQIAIAIRTARAFSLLQQRAMTTRAEHRASGAEEWRRLLRARRELAVVRNERGLYQIHDLWQPEMDRVVAGGEVAFADPDQRVLLAPIAVRDQVIAVVCARKPEDGQPWSYSETALVKTLCGQLGQALENARLYESVRQREEQARVLGQATARMRESLDVETVLQVAADEIRHALGLAALDVRLQMDGDVDA